MHKSHYNQLMRSKQAQSFGTLGPDNQMTRGLSQYGRTGGATSFLHPSDSSQIALNANNVTQS